MVEFELKKADLDECQYIPEQFIKPTTYSPSDLQKTVAEILKPLKGEEKH